MRHVVERSVLERFAEKLVARLAAVRIGPAVENPQMGPLVSEERLARVLKYIDIGKREGARLRPAYGRPTSRAHRVASKLQAGQVNINNYQGVNIEAPFGGYKQSGIGREKGVEAIHHDTPVKTVICLPRGRFVRAPAAGTRERCGMTAPFPS
jgi:acyl-CoA reductase-like NAD-dependent aldehyde dehydrogenase